MKIFFEQGTHEEGFGFPYPSNFQPGHTNNGYFDIKKHPEFIENIHELQGSSLLKDLIYTINEPKSFFRTLRCINFVREVQNQINFNFMVHGEITIAFEILEFNNNIQSYEILRNDFKIFAEKYPEMPLVAIAFKNVPTSYLDHGINRAWSQDIVMQGYGKNLAEAKQNYAYANNIITDFIVLENQLSDISAYPDKKKIS